MKFITRGLERLNREKDVFHSEQDASLSRRLARSYWLRTFRAGRWRALANYFMARLAINRGWTHIRSKPFFGSIEVTNACQLRCPFCFTSPLHEKHYLPFEYYSTLLDRFGRYLIKVEFHKNGEPFLHPRILDMIRISADMGIETSLSSNLNHLPNNSAEDVVRSGLFSITASIDGATQQTYSKYRAGGDFATAFGNLKALVAAKKKLYKFTPHLIWQFLVFRHNQHEMQQALRMARELDGNVMVRFAAGSVPGDPELEKEWKTTLPEFQESLCSDHDICVWPWGGISMFSDGSCTLCARDMAYRKGGADAGALVSGLWDGEYYCQARHHIWTRTRRDAPRIPFGETHPCAGCDQVGKLNFVYF